MEKREAAAAAAAAAASPAPAAPNDLEWDRDERVAVSAGALSGSVDGVIGSGTGNAAGNAKQNVSSGNLDKVHYILLSAVSFK